MLGSEMFVLLVVILVIGIMFILCIDVIKKNYNMIQTNKKGTNPVANETIPKNEESHLIAQYHLRLPD